MLYFLLKHVKLLVKIKKNGYSDFLLIIFTLELKSDLFGEPPRCLISNITMTKNVEVL